MPSNFQDDFRSAEAEVDAELRRKGKKLEQRTDEEFSKRVKQTFVKILYEPSFETGDLSTLYKIAYSLVPNMNYSLNDVIELCASEELGDWKLRESRRGLSIFMSALINKVIREHDLVSLRPRQYIFENYIGAFLEKGTLIIDGDAGDGVGYGLRGGKIIVKGNVDSDYGNNMEAGELTIEGEVRNSGLSGVKGGHAVLKRLNEKGYYQRTGIGIGYKQENGLIEIMCDVPISVQAIGWQQKGGELRVAGSVSCHHINYEQTGGRTHVKKSIVSKGETVIIGQSKAGGETIIDGDCIEIAREGYKREVLVGYHQEGGLIHVKRDVHGKVAFNGYPRAEIKIDGDVYGDVGDYRTAGTRVWIGRNVTGNVGDGVKDFDCTIDGNVHGNVGSGFGNHSSGKRDGRIEVKGNVYGNVGERMHSIYLGAFEKGIHSTPRIYIRGDVTGRVGHEMLFGEIHINGSIGQIGESFGGKIYQNGRNVTYIPVKNRMGKWLMKKLG